MKSLKIACLCFILVVLFVCDLAAAEISGLPRAASDAPRDSDSLFNALLIEKNDNFWQCASDASNENLKKPRKTVVKKSFRSKETDIPIYTNRRVKAFINLYAYKKRRVFNRAIERSAKYMKMIRRILKEYELPMDIAYLPVVESNFNPNARSKANAVGLWQFIAATGKRFGLKKSRWHDERYDPEKSTVAAAKYLKYLIKRFDGEWELALAAYNSGASKVENAVKKARKRNKPTDFWSLDLPRETRGYVPAFMAVVAMFHNLGYYGFRQSPAWRDEPQRQFVKAAGGVSLKKIARTLNLDYSTIKTMNPALRRGGIVPVGYRGYKISIPGRIKVSERQLKKLAALQKVGYKGLRKYRVAKGDTLWAISRRCRMSIDGITDLNPSLAKNKILKAGQKIFLPVSVDLTPAPKKSYAAYTKDKRTGNFFYYKAAAHKIKKGDTLHAISRKYNISIKRIRYLNPKIFRKKVLQVGGRVILEAPEEDRSTRYY